MRKKFLKILKHKTYGENLNFIIRSKISFSVKNITVHCYS